MTATQYDVALTRINCDGERPCRYGVIEGTSRPLVTYHEISNRKFIPVPLHNNIEGKLSPGGDDGLPLITWTEGSYHYIISLFAGQRGELIAAANSAIDMNGHVEADSTPGGRKH